MRSFLLIAFLVITLPTYAQQAPMTVDAIRKEEMDLRHFADSIMKGTTDAVRRVSAAAFNPLFLDLLNHPETFSYPFDSLPTISKLSSSDKKLRIYTWILPDREAGTFKYFGVMQRINPATGVMKVIGLMETPIETPEAVVNELKPDTWYGAAYYEMIEKKIGKTPYYFLLGWKGNDRFTTKKVIDLVYFDAWDNPTFGAPVFTDDTGKKKHRFIFEFNAQAVMLLRYEPKKKMIVFDHLSPASPSNKGQFRYYGPDFTYDGLQFKRGNWIYKTNLDLRNRGDKK